MSKIYYTQKEIADMMGVTVSTVRRWQKLGCPFIRVGAKMEGGGCRTRLDSEKVKAWLETRSAASGGSDTQKGGKA